jgi:hypothetical protein
MTKVKKTKKPKSKAKKIAKKTVTKKQIFVDSAKVEKIDAKLRPTPPAQLVKIDPLLRNPLKIVDVPRSSILPAALPTFARAPAALPTYMFSGQDTANLNRRLDVISSREQQLERKFLDLKNEFNNKEKEVKALEDLNAIQMLNQEIENLKTNWSNEEYDFLKTQINEMLSENLTRANMDLLIDLKSELKTIKNKHVVEMAEASMPSDIFSRFKGIFSKKETKTLLDDKIVDNDLVDEANEARSKIRVSNINLLDDEIYNNKLMDNKQILSSEMDELFGNIA